MVGEVIMFTSYQPTLPFKLPTPYDDRHRASATSLLADLKLGVRNIEMIQTTNLTCTRTK